MTVARRWRASRGLVAVAIALLLAVGLGTPARAATFDGAGWWWRAQTGLIPLPKPANVPDGGLMVAGVPEGATAVAAVAFTVERGQSSARLTLTVAPGGNRGGPQAVVLACPAGVAWVPEEAGRWDDRPTAECGRASVTGVPSDDLSTFSFDVGPLIRNGRVDVVLRPGKVDEAPEGADGSSFELVFEAPDAGSLEEGVGQDGGGDLGGDDFEFEDDFSDDFDDDGFGGGDGSVGGDFGGDFGGDDFGGGEDFSAPGLDDGGVDDDLGAGSESSDDEGSDEAAFGGGDDPGRPEPAATTGDIQLLGLFIAALCLVAAVVVMKQPVPAPRRLGRFAHTPATATAATGAAPEPATGGLGRFARVRTGAPPPL